MKKANIFVHGELAGILCEHVSNKEYTFEYDAGYQGDSVSLTMPTLQKDYRFDKFPSFFDGLLPEGLQLEGLLRISKLDRTNYWGQLMAVGGDLVGAVTVEEVS